MRLKRLYLINYLKKLAKGKEIKVIYGEITFYEKQEDRDHIEHFYRTNGFTIFKSNGSEFFDRFRLEIV